ncbi:MAG: hypothetical protein WCW78_02655 [Candidatus Paceibacterota bacterium]|jgi:hypothetical protein
MSSEIKESRLNRYFDKMMRIGSLGASTLPRELFVSGSKRDEMVENMIVTIGKVQGRAERVFNKLTREDEQTAVAFDIGKLHEHEKALREKKDDTFEISLAFVGIMSMSEGLKVFEQELGIEIS